MWKYRVSLDAAVRGGVHMHASPIRLKHLERRTRDGRLIHPMERLRKTDHPVSAQSGRQLFCPLLPPIDVANPGLRRLPFCFRKHV
jgi:hypothetical protein